jgi:hypothetical protein
MTARRTRTSPKEGNLRRLLNSGALAALLAMATLGQPTAADTLDEVLIERPLDPVNLKEEIEYRSIVAVRFAGVRFTGAIPWVNIVHRSGTGLKSMSFSSFREENSVEVYNRLFAAVSDRMSTVERDDGGRGEAGGRAVPEGHGP